MHVNQQLKVLIVDDDEDDFLILRETLNDISSDKFDIHWSNDYDESLQKIKSKLYHIYFIDYRLGKETGLALLNEAIKSGCEEPVIMLTGRGNKDIDIEAMTLGATDYLIKSELNAEKLERCIRYSLERTNYIKSLKLNHFILIYFSISSFSFIRVDDPENQIFISYKKFIILLSKSSIFFILLLINF